MRPFARKSLGVILAVGIAAGFAFAQEGRPEKHVTEIKAESAAKYPNGYADTKLCRWAKAEDPPYSRFRWVHPDLKSFSSSLADLMQKSDEVVLVGVDLRGVTALSPSEENAVSYDDSRVLRSWKGSHKVGDLITMGSLIGVIHCGLETREFSGTTPLYEGDAVYHGVNPVYAPAGPFVLFLTHDKSLEIESFRLAGGEGLQGRFDLGPSDSTDLKSPSSSCYRASFDQIFCHAYPHYPKGAPAFCSDERIDQANIAQCLAFLSSNTELMTERGFENDPLRQLYAGKPIASFLKDMEKAAESKQETAIRLGSN